MKNKILGLPKAAVIVIGIVITALFLVPVVISAMLRKQEGR